jgi:serine/threonine protein kinase
MTAIGEGSYGCIYKPPLPCKSKYVNLGQTDQKVMKVMNPCESNDNDISLVLRMIDPLEKYFLLVGDRSCVVDLDHVHDKCDNYETSSIKERKQFRGYLITQGEMTLGNYLHTHSVSIETLWDIIIHLLDGLYIMSQSGIVHLNIKFENILMLKGLPRLIDFGISRFVDLFSPDDLGYVDKYPNFVDATKTNWSTIEDLDSDGLEPSPENFLFMRFIDPNIDKDLALSNARNQYWNEIVLPNVFKIDIFSLARGFLDYFDESNISDKHKSDPRFESLYELLSLCVIPDYRKQYSLFDAIKYVKRVQKLGQI